MNTRATKADGEKLVGTAVAYVAIFAIEIALMFMPPVAFAIGLAVAGILFGMASIKALRMMPAMFAQAKAEKHFLIFLGVAAVDGAAVVAGLTPFILVPLAVASALIIRRYSAFIQMREMSPNLSNSIELTVFLICLVPLFMVHDSKELSMFAQLGWFVSLLPLFIVTFLLFWTANTVSRGENAYTSLAETMRDYLVKNKIRDTQTNVDAAIQEARTQNAALGQAEANTQQITVEILRGAGRRSFFAQAFYFLGGLITIFVLGGSFFMLAPAYLAWFGVAAITHRPVKTDDLVRGLRRVDAY